MDTNIPPFWDVTLSHTHAHIHSKTEKMDSNQKSNDISTNQIVSTLRPLTPEVYAKTALYHTSKLTHKHKHTRTSQQIRTLVNTDCVDVISQRTTRATNVRSAFLHTCTLKFEFSCPGSNGNSRETVGHWRHGARRK